MDDHPLTKFLAYLRGLGRAQNTLDAYQRDISQFLPFARERGVVSLTE